MIQIVNMHHRINLKENEIIVAVDRSSILGNPYHITATQDRDAVCDKYEKYFKDRIKNSVSFYNELIRIKELSRTKDVLLACWCYPKRCHAETIKNFLEVLT